MITDSVVSLIFSLFSLWSGKRVIGDNSLVIYTPRLRVAFLSGLLWTRMSMSIKVDLVAKMRAHRTELPTAFPRT